uniref:Phospholipase-like, aminotransferase-like mobile domain protein n=1 Tax=Tanacetum cinerariifolium TaxID=118510 RepID=A0A6L2LVK3_TANCI|nr:phospholipase-like, aminotransferase-like mobile domain protein [Tanacetum cinerariifolium]
MDMRGYEVPYVLVTCRSKLKLLKKIKDYLVALPEKNCLGYPVLVREELCLVTGLRFGVEIREEYETQANLPFRRRVFPSHLDGQPITGIDIANAIAGPTFVELYDVDVIGLCCLGILQLVLLGAKSIRNVPEWLLIIANDRGPLYVDQPTNEDDPITYSIFGYTWAFKILACFGSWLDITYVENDDVIGFKFAMASFHEYRYGDILFCNQLFPKKIGNDVKIIDVLALIEDEKKFSMVITCKTNRVEKEESLNKFDPQIEDLLKSTLEDEPDIKDNTSQDVGNPVSQPIYGDFSFDLAVLNGFWYQKMKMKKMIHYKYTYTSKQEDQIIRLADQRQHDDISKMVEESEHKIESQIQRLYDHREARLNKKEEEKQRKFMGNMNSSIHMKLAIKCCVPKKRKYIDVVRSPYYGLSETLNVPSMEKLANQKNDLKRPFNIIDKAFLSHDFEEWLSQSIVVHYKFPWLAYGVLLDVDDPVRAALAYRKK